MKLNKGFLVGLACVWCVGCGSEPTESTGTGALAIRITGEDAAKTGFPVEEEGESITFADGWTVQFSKFLIAFGAIDVKGADGTSGFTSTDKYVADLHAGDPSLPIIENLAARRWERFSYEISAPDVMAKPVGNVAAADIQTMATGKFNYWIEGTATKGADSITFAWGLSNPTKNADCTNGLDNTDGVVIRSNATTEAEITIHVEHLFWDTLGSENASLRFDALAAVAGADKDLTTEEIATQTLANLKDASGMPLKDGNGSPVIYNPGSVPLASQDLWAFIQASGASMAHLNGEGLCTISGL
jgi:hypothetical protein